MERFSQAQSRVQLPALDSAPLLQFQPCYSITPVPVPAGSSAEDLGLCAKQLQGESFRINSSLKRELKFEF